MSILKTNEIQPNTAGSLTITGDTTVNGTLSGSVISGTFHGDGSNLSGTGVNIQEQDGSPAIANATTLKFSNSSVTDEGGGVVSVAITTSGSWFRPASTSASPTDIGLSTQQAHTITGQLFTPTTTFSSSNPTIVSVVSQTYVSNNSMTVVLSSSTGTGSISLYAYNGAQQDDTPVTIATTQLAVNPPLLYFDFEEGAGVTLGNKSNTTYVSGAYSASAITGTMGGLFDNSTSVRGTWCGTFDGAGGKITLPMYPEYNMLDMLDTGVSGAFTFSCWVSSTSGHDYDFAVGAVLDIRASYYETGYGIGLPHSYAHRVSATKFPDNTSGNYSPSIELAGTPGLANMVVDTWYHILFTCDKSNNQFLYFNGQVIANITRGTPGTIRYDNTLGTSYHYEWRSIAGANHSYAEDYYLKAGYNTNNDYYYNGLMDEVAMFDYFMTPEQVAWVYNSGSTPPSLADGVPVLP